jgi:hypothetical protein
MTKVRGEKLSFYVMVFHICNIKKLMAFVATMKSLLYVISQYINIRIGK